MCTKWKWKKTGKPTVLRRDHCAAVVKLLCELWTEDRQLTDNAQTETLPHLYSCPQDSATLVWNDNKQCNVTMLLTGRHDDVTVSQQHCLVTVLFTSSKSFLSHNQRSQSTQRKHLRINFLQALYCYLKPNSITSSLMRDEVTDKFWAEESPRIVRNMFLIRKSLFVTTLQRQIGYKFHTFLLLTSDKWQTCSKPGMSK